MLPASSKACQALSCLQHRGIGKAVPHSPLLAHLTKVMPHWNQWLNSTLPELFYIVWAIKHSHISIFLPRMLWQSSKTAKPNTLLPSSLIELDAVNILHKFPPDRLLAPKQEPPHISPKEPLRPLPGTQFVNSCLRGHQSTRRLSRTNR